MKYSTIAGTGSYLPKEVLTNADLEKIVDTENTWIVNRTGIQKRHIAGANESTAIMAIAAAKKAIEAASITISDIELIIVATTTPDQSFPSTACLVQAALGQDGCPAFDVSAACAGFNYALSIADQFIRNGTICSALVIGSETMSRIIDWTDRSTCILFGDGAGAVVLKASDRPGIVSSHLHAAGSYKDLLYSERKFEKGSKGKVEKTIPCIGMRGREVFKIAVNKLSAVLEETLTDNKIDVKDIDWLIPHQANLRIIEAVAKKLAMSMEKVIVTIDKQGNTSAASIPLALDTAVRDGRIKRGQLLLMESFGAGFVWGSTLVHY